MIGYSVNTPFLKTLTQKSLRSKKAGVVFVTAINIISVYQWITTTRLEWFEDYFVQIVIGGLDGSLILQYVCVVLLIILRERMKPGSGFKKLKLPKLVR